MNKTTTYLSIIFLAFMMIVSACGSKTEESDESTSEEFKKAEEEVIKEQITTVIYDIPSPSEVPGLLERTGVEFNADLLHDHEMVDNYMTGNDKTALNLGVYSTDIGYLITYDKVQDALNYMSNSKRLADELGLSGTFENSMLEKFEANLSNKDSLVLLLDDAINDSEKFLKNEDRTRLASLLLTGSFVEALYISCSLIKNYPKDILPEDTRNMVLVDLIRVILTQQNSTGEVLRMLKSIDQSPPVQQLVVHFTKLNEAYTNLNIEDKIANNEGGLILTDQHVVEITAIAEAMRSEIIQ